MDRGNSTRSPPSERVTETWRQPWLPQAFRRLKYKCRLRHSALTTILKPLAQVANQGWKGLQYLLSLLVRAEAHRQCLRLYGQPQRHLPTSSGRKEALFRAILQIEGSTSGTQTYGVCSRSSSLKGKDFRKVEYQSSTGTGLVLCTGRH